MRLNAEIGEAGRLHRELAGRQFADRGQAARAVAWFAWWKGKQKEAAAQEELDKLCRLVLRHLRRLEKEEEFACRSHKR